MGEKKYHIPGATPLDIIAHALTGNLPKNAIPIRGKGNTDTLLLRKKEVVVNEATFARDRETNQLFILKSVGGKDLESTMADPTYVGNKTELDIYYIFEPLFVRNKFVSFTVDTTTDRTNINTDAHYYGGNTLLVNAATPISTPAMHAYPYIDTTKDRVLFSTAFDGQYVLLSDSTSLNTSMTTINPFHAVASGGDTVARYQGYTGNFLFGSCVTVLSKNQILIGSPDGLYYGQLQGNAVVKTSLALASNNLWNPISLHTALDKGDNTRGSVYMTAILNQRYVYQKNISNPGIASAHKTIITGTAVANSNDTTQQAIDYMGRTCVFKIPISGNAIIGEQATVIYGQIGNKDDTDFQMQITSYNNGWGGLSVTNCERDWVKYISEEQNKTFIMKTGLQAAPSIFPGGPELSNFSFGTDSFWCRQPYTWKSLLFFKKTEEPFIQVYTEAGNLVKNIPIYGNRFALDAKRLRICGTLSKVDNSMLTEEVVTTTNNGAPYTGYDCSNSNPFYMRGFSKVFHYGYLCKTKEKEYLLKGWNANPWFAQYMSQRNFYMQTGGLYDCTDMNPFVSCHGSSDVGSCWSTGQTLLSACSMYNPGITASGNGMTFGAILFFKFFDMECCIGFDPNGGASSGFGSEGGGYTPGQGTLQCGPVPNPTFPHGIAARTFTTKKEKHRFLDLLTASPTLCNVQTVVSTRKPPPSFYTELNDPANDKDPSNLWNDKRRFGNYRGPKLGVQDSDITETATADGISFTIKGKDEFILQPKFKAFESSSSNSVPATKTFTFTSAETMSPYDFAIMSNFKLISLVKKEYICDGKSLRTFIEQQSSEQASAIENVANDIADQTHARNLTWMTSLDWAMYSPIGLSDINPSDLLKYMGGKTLAGVYIYEGLTSVTAGTASKFTDGLTVLFGGKDTHSSGFYRIVMVRPVTFHFHSRARTTKCTDTAPSQTFSDIGIISKTGEIRETYIVAEK